MVENQVGIAVIVAAFAYFSYTELKKFWQKTAPKKSKNNAGQPQLNIIEYYKRALASLFQHQPIFFVLIGVVLVVFLLGLPAWLQFHQQGPNSITFLSIFKGSGNPYHIVDFLYPAKWSFLITDLFHQVISTLMFLGVIQAMELNASQVSIVFSVVFIIASLISSLCDAVLLLWLKDQVITHKIHRLSLLDRAKNIVPQLFLLKVIKVLIFILFGILHLKTINPLFLATSSPDEIPNIVIQLLATLVIFVLQIMFLVIPIIFVVREEHRLDQAFRDVQEFFHHHLHKYIEFIAVFGALCIGIVVSKLVLNYALPTSIRLVFAPWTYMGLCLQVISAFFIFILLGMFTLALLQLVNDLQSKQKKTHLEKPRS